MGALFAEGSISIGAEQPTTRPQTAPVFGSTIPARIRPPPTPPTEGGRRLRLWSSFGLSDLHVAVISGKEGDVREALRSNIADINELSGYGFTPLHMAAGHGKLAVAELLIEAGAAVEVLGDRGYTPLHLTAGHPDVARLLLKWGADWQAVDLDGFAPIHLAARAGHVRMLRVLLEAGGSVTAQGGPKSSTPLHLAARFGHISAVDCIVKTPIELEERLALMNAEDADMRTPLQVGVHKPECQSHLRGLLADTQQQKDAIEAERRKALGLGKKGKGKGKGKGTKKKK
eukprot:CAMPEP_0177786790 /NCGR_PEP_ID=MMETSP0491_2-20121128/21118_1 /TAXON_ID=63592 /ORGANISM="Tetraselmis chuii, Strain PLY429" /LENGTH=286 /DNA_ID=CAMNT_0019308039 /DNA_START=153 /DNA_END=1013 /DNA_ORIENTATION=-